MPMPPRRRLAVIALVVLFAGHAALQSRQQSTSALVIRNVTLIDGTAARRGKNATVVVEGTRITQVTTQAVTTPAGAQVIDGRGKFLIPGLIDVHVHLAAAAETEIRSP